MVTLSSELSWGLGVGAAATSALFAKDMWLFDSRGKLVGSLGRQAFVVASRIVSYAALAFTLFNAVKTIALSDSPIKAVIVSSVGAVSAAGITFVSGIGIDFVANIGTLIGTFRR